MGKIIGTIIMLGALAGIFFTAQEYWQKRHGGKNPFVDTLTPLIRLHVAKKVGSEEGSSASEASFMTILYYAHRAAAEGHDLISTVKSAASAAGAGKSEAARMATSINENVTLAKKMGVFGQANNEVAMERGDSPVATAKGWEDERMVIGHTLSPVLAPEAAYAIPNLIIMPECIRDMQTERVTTATTELARKWLVDQIIFPASKIDIEERMRASKN